MQASMSGRCHAIKGASPVPPPSKVNHSTSWAGATVCEWQLVQLDPLVAKNRANSPVAGLGPPRQDWPIHLGAGAVGDPYWRSRSAWCSIGSAAALVAPAGCNGRSVLGIVCPSGASYASTAIAPAAVPSAAPAVAPSSAPTAAPTAAAATCQLWYMKANQSWVGGEVKRGMTPAGAASSSLQYQRDGLCGHAPLCVPGAVSLSFTNSIEGRRPGQQRSALSGTPVPSGASRRRLGGVKGKKALARRNRPQSIVAPPPLGSTSQRKCVKHQRLSGTGPQPFSRTTCATNSTTVVCRAVTAAWVYKPA